MEKTYRFTLPQNKEVENTNVRVENGEVLVDVEFKEKFQPKDGDFLVSSRGKVFIYTGLSTRIRYGAYCGVNSNNNIDICHPLSSDWTKKEGCRYATPEEKADFLKRLEGEKHLRWNAEKKCIEDVRWRAGICCLYYYINLLGDVEYGKRLEIFDPETMYSDKDLRVIGYTDDNFYNSGNYFKTREAAEKVAEQIRDIFKNSKAE